jgi:hypothetical protein
VEGEFDYEGAEHVVINSHEGQFECENCGATYKPGMPCPIQMYLDMMSSWLRAHHKCKYRKENRLGDARHPVCSEGVPEESNRG